MKEVLRGDRFVLLYRLRFSGQDICGYHDLKDQFFYSQFATEEDELGQAVHTVLSLLVLYLYSAAVTPGGEEMVRDFGEHFRAAVSLEGKNRYPISVTARPLEGELMNTYAAGGGAGDPRPGGPGKTLQGTVRKLAPQAVRKLYWYLLLSQYVVVFRLNLNYILYILHCRFHFSDTLPR